MMDPRPEVSQDVDLTFLGVFSGYTNSHAMGHHTIPDHEREVDMTEWLTNKVDDPDVMVGIGFSNVPGDVVIPCDYIDLTETVPVVLGRRRSTTHSVRPSSQIKITHTDLHDKIIEKRIRGTVQQQDNVVAPNGCCIECGQPLRIPKMLNALYPRAHIAMRDIRHIVSRHDMCDRCARLKTIDILCGRDDESYSRPYTATYDYSNNNSTATYHTTVSYCDTFPAYTSSSIIPIVDYIEEHADRVSFYDNIAPLVTTFEIDSFGGIIQKKRALYHKLSNQFYNDAYTKVDLSNVRDLKKRLNAIAETIDDVWSTDVDGLKSALRVGSNFRAPINVQKTTGSVRDVSLASLSSGYNTINHYRCDELVRLLSKLLKLVLTKTYKSPTMVATTGEDYTSYIETAHWTTISTASVVNNITYVPNTNRYNTTITLYDDVHLF